MIRLVRIAVAFATSFVLLSCGGGGGGGSSSGSSGGSGGGGGGGGGGTPIGTTTFTGGPLSALQAINSGLSFDNLIITGTLDLPMNSATTTIRANNLTIASGGRISYTYGTCQWDTAPDLTLVVQQGATIDGEINLDGRFGTTVTGGAACAECNGASAGDIVLTANTINVSGKVSNNGGGGASSRSVGLPSIPCASGSSGKLQLAAVTSMDLSNATVQNSTGRNFNGTPGASLTSELTVQNGLFRMQRGSVSSTGTMTFRANSTDVFGAITYGTLSETIGGQSDTTGPAVTVVSPAANASLTFNTSVDVQVQASDSGAGFKEVRINGLGYDKTHPATDFVGSTLTVPVIVPDIASPATLVITGKDNKGNTTTVSIAGLQIGFPPEIEPNDTFAAAVQTLAKGSPLEGMIRNGDSGQVFSPVPANLGANRLGQAKIEDFYKVVCCDRIMDNDGFFILGRKLQISLDFSADGALQPDIDVYLLNPAGTTVIASSTRDNVGLNSYTETILAGGAGSNVFSAANEGQSYIVAVQAWHVPGTTRYKIRRD